MLFATIAIFRMIVPRCKITAGNKVTIIAGSFFHGPGCCIHGGNAVDLTVGRGENHGSITAGHNNDDQPIFAPSNLPTKEPETTALTETTTVSVPEFSTAIFSTTVSLTNSSSASTESLSLILVAIFLNFLLNRF